MNGVDMSEMNYYRLRNQRLEMINPLEAEM